ncbi:hypothetical protein [Stenotrophomonas sp. 24(2023)]|uniref:hypothetical protein n=1 Tax=Stenotrophomonas sp. 24(2023) TaxID=3068324 RepID=UPI0027E0F46D|nr:hypothetical protein [Stenotrophomonas sp. 24(2023)]WMJ70978.1 hypothetical protein Q9R17_07730 [Stenotrophomonas sp. 24(2023)]
MSAPPHPAGIAHNLVRPLALAATLVGAALTLCSLAAALMAWGFQGGDRWQELVTLGQAGNWPGSAMWPLSHLFPLSLWTVLLCLLSTLSSWGMYRWRRWGLWSFVVLLVLGIVFNFAAAWWVDDLLARFGALLDDPRQAGQLQVQRVVAGLALYGGAVLMLLLQGWLAWRLLRPDVRRLFH